MNKSINILIYSKGAILMLKDGSYVDMKPYDPNIDTALFPVLLAYGQTSYESGIEYKKQNIDELKALRQQEEEKGNQPQQHIDGANEDDEEGNEEHPDGETTNCGPKPFRRNDTNEDDEEGQEETDGETTDKGAKPFRKKKGEHLYVSQRQFYRHLFYNRGDWQAYHWLWWAGWLAQIFIITVYNRIEAIEAAVIEKARANLRSMLPEVLITAIQNKINRVHGACKKLGKVIFAPSTTRGSRKYYQKAYADAQAICRAFGNPHLFLTYTMNSEAPEYDIFLKPGQTWADIPVHVARLFINKHRELMKDIVEREVLGPVAAWFSSVEHQKRY
jgi:hypothetical protein